MTQTGTSRHHTRQRSAALRVGLAGIALAILIGCAPMRNQQPVDYPAIVAASDRSDADRKTDARRKPDQLLAFTGVRPGMKVLDMATGGGYSTELLARAVGPDGVVYGQDAPTSNANARASFEARAKTPAMQKVVRVVRSFDDPVPAETPQFDLITFFFEYHEMPKAGIDFAKMNRRLFDLLKPGGLLIVADHSAVAGAAGDVGPTLHRVEESFVRRNVEAAGFRLVEEGNFLRSPADTRDTVVFRNPVPNDEFVLKFRKPD